MLVCLLIRFSSRYNKFDLDFFDRVYYYVHTHQACLVYSSYAATVLLAAVYMMLLFLIPFIHQSGCWIVKSSTILNMASNVRIWFSIQYNECFMFRSCFIVIYLFCGKQAGRQQHFLRFRCSKILVGNIDNWQFGEMMVWLKQKHKLVGKWIGLYHTEPCCLPSWIILFSTRSRVVCTLYSLFGWGEVANWVIAIFMSSFIFFFTTLYTFFALWKHLFWQNSVKFLCKIFE